MKKKSHPKCYRVAFLFGLNQCPELSDIHQIFAS